MASPPALSSSVLLLQMPAAFPPLNFAASLTRRWYQFGAPWERMAVDIAGPLPCKPCGCRCLPAATGQPPGGELPQTSPEVVAALQQRWYQPRAGDVQMPWATASALSNPRERQGLAPSLQSNCESP